MQIVDHPQSTSLTAPASGSQSGSLHQIGEFSEIELEADAAILEVRLVARAFHCMAYELAGNLSTLGQDRKSSCRERVCLYV